MQVLVALESGVVSGSIRRARNSPEGASKPIPLAGRQGYLLFGSSGRTGRSFSSLFFLFKLSLMLL